MGVFDGRRRARPHQNRDCRTGVERQRLEPEHPHWGAREGWTLHEELEVHLRTLRCSNQLTVERRVIDVLTEPVARWGVAVCCENTVPVARSTEGEGDRIADAGHVYF